ncbi:hypothetical protein D1007_23239 [Hordeum vulgare]|nr:hypothetical protein D1007_23239 [Hordeum vulgare]
MMAMVVRELISRRIAPLQRHSHPMWAFTGPRDPMRVRVLPHSPDVLHGLLHRLTGGDPEELPLNGLPLYKFNAAGALIAGMPLFHEWVSLPGDAHPQGARRLGCIPMRATVTPPLRG